MRYGGYLIGAAVAGALMYMATRAGSSQDETVDTSAGDSWSIDGDVGDSWGAVMEGLDSWSGGIVKTSAMRSINPDTYLASPNVKAVLRVIRTGEGTADAGGYLRLYGGSAFSGYDDHPRLAVTKWGRTSTAAGAYQFLSKVWDETKSAMGLKDFSPINQDRAAVGRIAARGALADAVAGRFDAVMSKINKEWASMPGSPYGQGGLSLAKARALFADAGGTNDTGVA